jgi:lipid-A-disaccharide synthase
VSAVSKLPRIAIVAGEPSGDALAAPLVRALKQLRPEIDFVGIAGPQMLAAGVRALFPMDKLAVMGLAEVARHFFEILGIRRQLLAALLREPPDLFIGIDAPDFNLGLETSLRAAGVRTVQYVGPTVWAWRAGRIERVKRAADHVLVLFPFEPAIYERHGIPVTFVGHPLADAIPMRPDRAAARAALGLAPDIPVVALLPGSRANELKYLGRIFVDTAALLRERLPGVRLLVPLVNALTREMFVSAAARRGGIDALGMRLLDGQAQQAMAAADGVIATSGTATLEAALHKRPLVITYRMSPFTWWLVKDKGYLRHVGMPNILADREVVPEYIQDAATPENLVDGLMAQLRDPRRLADIERAFTEIHRRLRCDNAHTAARAVLGMLAP